MKHKPKYSEQTKKQAERRWQKMQRKQSTKPITAVNYRRQFRRKTG